MKPNYKKSRIHITGVSGFIGSNLAKTLSEQFTVTGSGRNYKTPNNHCIDYFSVDWSNINSIQKNIFKFTNVVIHCAGLAHNLNNKISYQTYFKNNVISAVNAFQIAKDSGVEKFIYMSSISIFDTSKEIMKINDESIPSPTNDYGKSKLVAEKELINKALDSKIELLILRLPMVVGIDSPGNFNRLINFLNHPLPFPLINVNRYRSLLSIESLSSFIFYSILNKNINSTFILNLANKPAISIKELIENLRLGLGVKNFTFKVPEKLLFFSFSLLGIKSLYNKIYGSLEIEPSRAALELGWEPLENLKSILYQIGIKYKIKSKNDNFK